MHPSDAEKTTFVTDMEIYCYLAMPFGLRNAGATFQCLVNKMFKEQIGKTMEVYTDDMVVKSNNASEHVKDLAETFDILRAYNMKLNPAKCNFDVSSGKFLGHMVTRRGIEASPEQIKASFELTSPTSVKDVQKLTVTSGCLEQIYLMLIRQVLVILRRVKEAIRAFTGRTYMKRHSWN